MAQLSQNLGFDRIPVTFIAQSGSEVEGTVSIDLSDLPGFDQLSPWLASLYVVPKVRGKGIGTALIQYVLRFARASGISPLYLWTPGPTSLYEKCGWATLRSTIYNSHPITLMRAQLS